MDFFYFLAAFLIVKRLDKDIRHTALHNKWHSLLNIASWLIVAVYIGLLFVFEEAVRDLAGAALLLGVGLYATREIDFQHKRKFLEASYPLAALAFITGIIKLINDGFYDKYETFFVIPVIAAFVWIFARAATSKKQEEELRISAERRAQLEILVTERTAELQKQKEELQETILELKNTQNQLIQSEKMASLGELTAGIAHEIQNPLNFVNNFSEVNTELIGEMKEEIEKGDLEEIKAIALDIEENSKKISMHGKRADGIVKGMLQHSRTSGGDKQLTNINALADEFLRLSYHGLRAKDKSFNAEMVTHFDPDLPKVNVIPQDMGRVLLNLFNNAFYAVNQKEKTAGPGYKPAVEVSTAIAPPPAGGGGGLLITVKDNGTGIPDAIKEKIMQPFFTTKPTGEGTGLGLSLTYDMVVKGHGGTIDVKSEDGIGSEFIIKLPIDLIV